MFLNKKKIMVISTFLRWKFAVQKNIQFIPKTKSLEHKHWKVPQQFLRGIVKYFNAIVFLSLLIHNRQQNLSQSSLWRRGINQNKFI